MSSVAKKAKMQWSPRLSSLFCAGALMLWTQAANAYYDTYLPGPLVNKVRKLKQHQIGEFGANWTSTVNGVDIENKDGKFSLKGVNKQGKAWSLNDEEDRNFGGSAFVGDVDRNGVDDLIFVFETGSCGYSFQALNIVFFDKNGDPHQDECTSRLSWNKNGVDDLLASADGKCGYVIVQDLAYGNFKNRDLGYWRFSMNCLRNCKMKEAKTAFGMRFPSYVWFTTKPNHLLSAHAQELEKEYQAAQKRMETDNPAAKK